MKRCAVLAVIVGIMFASPFLTAAIAQTAATPPGQPASGYGSSENYICDGYTRIARGSYWQGTAVNVFIPKKLKYRCKAPVVIFLHGYLAVLPEIYLDAIKHQTNQGNIVIFPQMNLVNPCRLLSDTNQNVMLQRAINNAKTGFAVAGRRADRRKVYAFGHSLGGLFVFCWNGAGGPRAKGIVSANLATDSTQGIPDFIQRFIKIIPVDWKSYAHEVDVPSMVLAGDQDTISGVGQATDMYNELTSAPSRVLYCLQTDKHGAPPLMADHNASMCRFLPGLNWVLRSVGGDAEVDATDYRYYWAALDAMMAGEAKPSFDMGSWSDGLPVKLVLRLAP
jgi:dienelactone hydrolase